MRKLIFFQEHLDNYNDTQHFVAVWFGVCFNITRCGIREVKQASNDERGKKKNVI